MIRPSGLAGLLIGAVLGLACTSPSGGAMGMNGGTGGSAGSGTGGGPDTGGSAGPDAGAPDAQPSTFEPDLTPLPDTDTVPGPAPLRRLSLLEYGNTIRDLLGLAAPAPSVRSRFLSDFDTGHSGFTRGTPIVNGQDVLAFLLSGEVIGAAAAQKLPVLLPCNPIPTGEAEREACAVEFIAAFGLRAYRRPLAQKESDKLLALYRTLRGTDAGDSFEEAIGDLVTAMVNAPELLYHAEQEPMPVVKEGRLVRFGQYQLASRLSYLFWASTPDQSLLDAAREGQLADTAQLVRQAQRLFADDRARDAVKDFYWQWEEGEALDEVAKDPALVDFSPAVARSMIEESREFAASLFFGAQADGRLETLLTGTGSFADAGLAKIYGLPAPMGMGLQPVSLSATERSGIFTRAAFLALKADAGQSNPVMRGEAILRRVMCLELPVPNVDIPSPPAPSPGVTTRARFASVDNQVCAMACHTVIDPIGFAFENYDAIGAYRTKDQGEPVDASGAVKMVFASDLVFKDALDLMPQLAASNEARDCMATQWLRYLLRRREAPGEGPTERALGHLFRDRGYDMRHLPFGLVRSHLFTHRAFMEGETL
jgi:hypothetical protein